MPVGSSSYVVSAENTEREREGESEAEGEGKGGENPRRLAGALKLSPLPCSLRCPLLHCASK